MAPKDTNKEKTTSKAISMRIPEPLSDKLDYIAWHDRKDKAEIYRKAFEELVTKWESENHPITANKIEKSKA